MADVRRVEGRRAFPRIRWLAAAWLILWPLAYLSHYGWHVFLNLSDIAVALTCIGLWTGSPLLLSSQAVSSLAVDLAWILDLVVRAISGRHVIGGTEYMWDARYPLWLRLLSLFHVWMPIVLVWSLRRVGYDRRGFGLQALIAVPVMLASRLMLGPDENQNFAWHDPWLGRSWGPGAVHVGLTLAVLIAGVYWPTHRLLSWLLPRRAANGR